MFRIAIGGLLIAAGLGLWSCASAPARATADAPRRTIVAVARATREDLSRGIELAAEFRPYQEIDIHAKVAGYVKAINVDVGDHVQRGQVLALLEVPEMQEELKQAQATEKRSTLDVERSKSELQRAMTAHSIRHLGAERLASVIKLRPNLVAQQEIDEAAARDREAEAQIDSAKAALAAAQQQVSIAGANRQRIQTLLDYTRITAPFAGVITRRFADTGAMVQAGTASQTQAMPVVRLSQNDRLRLVLPVPETVVPRIHLGQRVAVRVPALSNTFEGTVARFSQNVDLSTRTMETEVDVANPRLVLMPGMYAYATLTLDHRRGALAIPVQAVSGGQGSSTVMVVNLQNQIEERQVKLGIETPSMIEVLAGLKKDEMVVIGNRSRFKPGQPVEPKLVEASELKGS